MPLLTDPRRLSLASRQRLSPKMAPCTYAPPVFSHKVLCLPLLHPGLQWAKCHLPKNGAQSSGLARGDSSPISRLSMTEKKKKADVSYVKTESPKPENTVASGYIKGERDDLGGLYLRAVLFFTAFSLAMARLLSCPCIYKGYYNRALFLYCI